MISLFDADNINENFSIVTQNSNTLSVKYKSEKITYKGKFNYSSQFKLMQSSVYSAYLFINNKLDGSITGVNFKIGETYSAVSSTKNMNKFISKLFKKNDTLIGGKANDNLWGYLGNDKISGGTGNDFLCGGKGKIINWRERKDILNIYW